MSLDVAFYLILGNIWAVGALTNEGKPNGFLWAIAFLNLGMACLSGFKIL